MDDIELQSINSETLNRTPSPTQCADPTDVAKILIKDESYPVDQNLKPLQKHALTQSIASSDVSIDVPPHRYHEDTDQSSSPEVQVPLPVESSGENNIEEREPWYMKENYYGDVIDRNDDDFAYFKCLAIILRGVSEELLASILNGNASCIPTANKELVAIIEDLDLPIQTYSEHQENLTTMKLANMQVKRRYKQLKRVIEKFSEEKNLQGSFNISPEKFLDKPGLLEYAESREIKSLVRAINKLNKTSLRRAPCKVM